MKLLTFLIDKDLHLTFKIQCAKNGVSMTEILISLISGWIGKERVKSLREKAEMEEYVKNKKEL